MDQSLPFVSVNVNQYNLSLQSGMAMKNNFRFRFDYHTLKPLANHFKFMIGLITYSHF